MKYPKLFMTTAELSALGLSPKMLRKLYHSVGYPLAFKESNAQASPIKFNTELLDKHLKMLNERRA